MLGEILINEIQGRKNLGQLLEIFGLVDGQIRRKEWFVYEGKCRVSCSVQLLSSKRLWNMQGDCPIDGGIKCLHIELRGEDKYGDINQNTVSQNQSNVSLFTHQGL